jgi:acyl-CoA thioester hydrolase
VLKRRLAIRPLFHQTDMMGVIHNSIYFLWFEEGWMQFMLDVLPMDEAQRLGVVMPVVENACTYAKPVRFGDPLLLFTTHEVPPVYAGRLVFRHSLVHAKHKTEMASGQTVTTLLDSRTGQLLREWPADLWRRYQALQ